MKKLLIRLAIALVVVIILAIVAVGIFLDSIVKRGVETVGPALTKVDVKLDSVSLSLLSGSGKIQGLLVGNPEGFKTPSAIKVGSASLALKPGSVFGDKVIIRSINVQGPEITYETDLRTSNLNKILANLDSGNTTNQPASTQAKAAKKLEVDEFIIDGGKVNVSVSTLGGKSVTVPLPAIHLTDLGTGPEGITAAELTRRVLQEIQKSAAQVASSAATDLSKQAVGLTKGLGKDATGAVDSVTKGLGNLFKK